MSDQNQSHVVFIPDGDLIRFGVAHPRETMDHIPAGIYEPLVEHEPNGIKIGLRKVAPKFYQTSTIRYGTFNKNKAAIIAGINARQDTITGIYAIGRPGSGKTLLAQDIANHLVSLGLPVIYVKSHVDISIIHEMARVIGRCMIFFDEFGKNYRTNDNSDIDADDNAKPTSDSGKLLVLASDESLKGSVIFLASNKNDNFSPVGVVNRPGRFTYRIDGDRMESSSFLEQIELAKLNTTLRDYVIFNVFGSDLKSPDDMWSSDALRFFLNLIEQDDSLVSVQDKLENINLPNFSNYQVVLTVLDNGDLYHKYDSYRIDGQYHNGKIVGTVRFVTREDESRLIKQTFEADLDLLQYCRACVLGQVREWPKITVDFNGEPITISVTFQATRGTDVVEASSRGYRQIDKHGHIPTEDECDEHALQQVSRRIKEAKDRADNPPPESSEDRPMRGSFMIGRGANSPLSIFEDSQAAGGFGVGVVRGGYLPASENGLRDGRS